MALDVQNNIAVRNTSANQPCRFILFVTTLWLCSHLMWRSGGSVIPGRVRRNLDGIGAHGPWYLQLQRGGKAVLDGCASAGWPPLMPLAGITCSSAIKEPLLCDRVSSRSVTHTRAAVGMTPCMGPCYCVWLLQWIRGLLGFIAFGGLHDREAADCASMQHGAGCETRCHHQRQCMRCWSGCGDLIACTCDVSTSICEAGRHLRDRYIRRRRAPTMQSTVHNAT